MTGTAGNDTINALYSSTNGMTYGSNDSIDGGAGNDVLSIQVGTTAIAGPASLTGVESVTANFLAAGTVNLLNATGLTSIESNGSSAAATFSNIGSLTPTLRVSNTNQDTTFGYTAATVAGTADAATIELNGVSGGTITIAGIENLTLNSRSAANVVTGVTAANATTINVGGDQALNLGTLGSTVTTLNAGANTSTGAGVTAIMGAVASATITGGTGNDDITIDGVTGNVSLAGGAGNDTIRVAANLTATDTISGGDGTADVLRTTAAIAEGYVAPATRTITGFEQLTLTTAGTASTTLTTANVDTGITRVNLAGTAGAYGVTGPAGAVTVTSTAALGGTLTLTDTGTAITDSVTLTNSGVANANVLAGQNVTSTGYETLTINVGSGSATNLAAQTLGTVTITPDTGGTGALVLTGANTLTMGATNAPSIDASGLTGTTGLNQSAAPTATTVTITGSGKADTLVGGTGNDTISGGAGNDNITGGVGADSMTGGDGADTFVFAANATGAVVSNAGTLDTITDFVSGTDKLNITNITSGAVSKFLGNYANFTAANTAALADGTAGLAFFVTGENTLYVQATAGTQGVNDTVIKLNAVTSLTAADLLLGAQGTGNTIATTAAAAVINNTTNTNATFPTTGLDDTITSTYANMVGTVINGGAGNDSLTVSTVPTAAFDLATGNPLVSVENLTLSAGSGAFTVTLPATANMRVTNGSSTAASVIAFAAASGQTFTASGTGQNTITVGNTGQSITGGSGVDIVSATAANYLNGSFNGGAGTGDILNFTTAGALVLTSAAPSAASAQIAGIETIHVIGGNTLTITPDQALTVNLDGTGAGTTITGTGSTITVTNTTVTVNGTTYTADLTDALTLAGTSNFTSSSAITGTITNTSTGTVSVTTGVTGTVNSTTAITVNAAAMTGTTNIQGNGNFTVTGIGGADDAGGGSTGLTEANTHTTGTLTVNTAGANTHIVTLSTSGAGAVVINAAHTGVTTEGLTVATSTLTGRSLTVNVTGATGAVTITGSNAANIVSTAGAHSITGGSGADTITGFTGSDTIVAGDGADVVDLGTGGTDVFNLGAPTTNTGLAAGFVASTAVPANGTVINVSGLDKVTNFGVGDTITTGLTETGLIARNGQTLGAGTNTANALDTAMITGTYDAAAGTFTVSLAGTSTLFVYDDNGDTALGSLRGIVLVGYIDQGGLDTYNGTLTSVA